MSAFGAFAKTFAAFGLRDFRRLWLGSLSAFVGFFTSVVVQSVVAFDLAGENRAVGVVVFGRGLAMLVLGPVAGAYVDRIRKKSILIVCQTFTALVFFGLAWLMASGRMRVPHLALGAFLVGSTFAFLGPTRQAYVLELVPESGRGNAIALNQVALNASRLLGPALAGALLAWEPSGATGAFVLMGLLYLLAVLTQLGLPSVAPPADASAHGILSDVVEGMRYVRDARRLRLLVLFFVLVIMLGFPHVSVLPGFVRNVLGRDASEVSLLFGVSAVGGLVASLAVAPFADSRRVLALYASTGIGFGLSLVLLAAASTLAGAALAMALVGVTSGAVLALNGAVLLRATDPRYYGRVLSLAMLAFAGFGLVGLPVGWLADAVGERATLVASGSAVSIAVAILAWRLGRLPEVAAETVSPA